MRRRAAVMAAIVAGLLVTIGGPLLATFLDDAEVEQRSPLLDTASTAAEEFLTRYVDPDGRVVRRDQGGDTVSQGQAGALLVSVAIGDRGRFDSIWGWAKHNLQQPNGLFAQHWANGALQNSSVATDANLDLARALSIASVRFEDRSYASEGRVLAQAIEDNLLAYAGEGGQIIIAGSWAGKVPYYVNPGYHSPRAEQELFELTDDPRWHDVQTRQRQLIDDLIGSEEVPRLPPDWAVVGLDGTASPATSPGVPAVTQRYSFDAVRVPIHLAESCAALDRAQAERMWTILNKSRESRFATAMSLDGDVLDDHELAAAAVASAAAAKSAGDTQQMNDLLDLAMRIDTENPSSYGSAWVALGRIMLTTDWLESCP